MAKEDHVSPRRTLPRSRGATSGLLLLLLGAWGALIPFIGPYFNFSYTPDKAWTWSAARGWLEVLPGAVVFVGGVLLLTSRSRSTTVLGAWLGIAGGAWFVIGPGLASLLHLGSPGVPAGSSTGVRALETLALFTLLGTVIVYLAASAFGRLTVVSQRDVRAAERQERANAEQRTAEEAVRQRRMAEARRDEEQAGQSSRRDEQEPPAYAQPQPYAQPQAYAQPGYAQQPQGPAQQPPGYPRSADGATAADPADDPRG